MIIDITDRHITRIRVMQYNNRTEHTWGVDIESPCGLNPAEEQVAIANITRHADYLISESTQFKTIKKAPYTLLNSSDFIKDI